MALVVLAAALALAVPPANAPLPREPRELAAALVRTEDALDTSVDRWLAAGGSATPEDVVLTALYEQRLYRLLGRKPALAGRTLPLIPPRLRPVVRDNVAARSDLYRLSTPRPRKIRVGAALPATRLLGFYREAERRFGVRWELLAAVNLVESAFGRVRSSSAAGAQGPMQFLPATWRRYGLGGNVHDPHDAILGAANYLRANGARRDERSALYGYNHSWLYVDAVRRYAARIAADPRAYYAYHAWQVFVRTPSGERRVTGPRL